MNFGRERNWLLATTLYLPHGHVFSPSRLPPAVFNKCCNRPPLNSKCLSGANSECLILSHFGRFSLTLPVHPPSCLLKPVPPVLWSPPRFPRCRRPRASGRGFRGPLRRRRPLHRPQRGRPLRPNRSTWTGSELLAPESCQVPWVGWPSFDAPKEMVGNRCKLGEKKHTSIHIVK